MKRVFECSTKRLLRKKNRFSWSIFVISICKQYLSLCGIFSAPVEEHHEVISGAQQSNENTLNLLGTEINN